LLRAGSRRYSPGVTLEDSLGDIIRKARTSTQITPEAAAQAAGLGIAAYTALEETGEAPAGVNYAALGKLLTLDGARLERQAKGWRPAPVDVTAWCELRVITTSGDGMTVNAYLVWDEVTREAALFDTGFEAAPILALLEENQLTLKHIFITHSHPDHIAGLADLRAKLPKVRVHSGSKNAPVDQRLRGNDCITLGSLRVTNRDTPGHAEDGITYVVGNWPADAPFVAVVGDAIFAGSMGGARDQLELARAKVREQIFSLPPDTLICSGHGPLTTVAEEKANNPWFS
jgi:glyoxylase-like metal-dependent hydrolase (beta-lactamase superfamily II)